MYWLALSALGRQRTYRDKAKINVSFAFSSNGAVADAAALLGRGPHVVLAVITNLYGPSRISARRVWLIEWWDSHLPKYNPGAGQAFGLLLFGSLTIGLGWGVVVRILSLWWICTNRSSEIRGAAIHTAGFFCLAAAVAIFFHRPL